MRLAQFLDSLSKDQLIDRLNLALDGASLGIWDWDLRDNSVQFDRRWCEILGLSVEAITMDLSTWSDRVHPDDIAGCYADIQAYLRGDTQVYENIHRMRHAKGEWIYILDRGRVSGWDAQGRAIRFTGTHFDCTATERAKRILQHQRELFAELVRNLPSAVAMFDANDRYLAASDEWLRAYALDVDLIVGRTHSELGSSLPLEWARPWLEAKTGKCVSSEQEPVRWTDGLQRYLRWSMRPWRSGDDGVAGLIVTFEDVTKTIEERMARERELRLSALGLMAGGVAHEINTPLQSMLLHAALIDESLAVESPKLDFLRQSSSAIVSTIKQITGIVEALRTVSRCRPSDPLIRVDVRTLVLQIVELSRSRFANAGITFHTELPDPCDAQVMARPADIGQILLNLLNNAFDAVVDRAQPWVKLTIDLLDSEVVLRVTDSGLGVAADIQDKLMTPFYTTKPLGQGSGLGLSLSKSLAENLGGLLVYVSTATHTTFELRLVRVRDGDE